jgi:CheY-like chemotaxis protein
MDCMMPGIDGCETVRRIRRVEARTVREPATIVALTANARDDELRRCMNAGMNAFLSKPLSLQALGRVLQDWRAAARR